jgi:hypothetical protein
MRLVNVASWKGMGAPTLKERHFFCFEKSRTLRSIVIDQKWKTGPTSHVQFVLLVKLS